MDQQTRILETRLSGRLTQLFYQPGQLLKTADIGGDPEREFEDTFASLALVYIRDKAPRLLDYLVGFQLIERDDDNNRAVGAFVFRPGQLWLLVYVFFLGGKMRGHEMVHVHNQDQFLPLKERWINTLIAARSPVLGKGVEQSRAARGWIAPRLTDLTIPPNFGKMSAEGVREFFEPFVNTFRQLVSENPLECEKRRGHQLTDLLEKSAEARDEFLNWTQFYPTLAQYAEKRLGAGWFDRMGEAQKQAAIRSRELLDRESLLAPRLKTAADKPKLKIITELENEAEELSPDDRERFLRDGFLVRDDRDEQEVSRAWKTELRVGGANPTETGVYDVLTSDKGLERLLVLVHPRTASNRDMFSIVIDPSDSGRWERTPGNRVYARLSPLQRDEWNEWWSGLDGVQPSDDEGSLYCLVTRQGDSMGPFRVLSGQDGSWTIECGENAQDGWRDMPNRAGDPVYLFNKRTREQEDDSRRVTRCALVRTERKGASLCSVGDVTYFPKDDCKFVKIKVDREKPIELTDVAGLQRLMGVKTASLKVWANDHECVINGGRPMSRKQALFNLVRDVGLREHEAREIITIADQDRRSNRPQSRFWLTKSAGPETPNSASMPPPPSLEAPTGDPYGLGLTMVPDQTQHVRALVPDRRRRSPYRPRAAMPDDGLMNSVQQAVESGQQDLVDTTAIAGLLRTSGVEGHISEYTSGLMKDVDRLCRLLILFYWHGKYFQQQYGKAALPEMEDRIRSAIELVGDTILDLREKLRDIPGQESILT